MTADTLILAVISSTVVSASVSFALNTLWGRKFAARDAAALESIKNDLLRELERAKHLLQLEQAKLSIIYENQKTSFSDIIRAMDTAIAALEATFDYDLEEFSSISEDVLDAFQRTRSRESLYVGSEGDEILDLFEEILRETVGDRDNMGQISDAKLRWSRKQLRFIFGCAKDYFRYRIGLSEEDRTLDVAIVAAIRLLNNVSFGNKPLTIFPQFDCTDYSDFRELVLVGQRDSHDLSLALLGFENAIESKADRRGFFFEYFDQSRRLRARLDQPRGQL